MRKKEIVELSSLIKRINGAKEDIAELIGRPAAIQGIGESIAAEILGVSLQETAPHIRRTGVFLDGPMKGKRVEIEWQVRSFDAVSVGEEADCLLYLVGISSFYRTPHEYYRPWLINSVYFIDPEELSRLRKSDQGCIWDISMKKEEWKKFEIYPESNSQHLVLDEGQKEMFGLFSG
jgi:hypothetical protein